MFSVLQLITLFKSQRKLKLSLHCHIVEFWRNVLLLNFQSLVCRLQHLACKKVADGLSLK